MIAQKSYHNFFHGMKDMCKISPYIQSLMSYENGFVPKKHNEALGKILEVFSHNPPDNRLNRSNSSSLHISGNSVSYKLDGQLSFGWKSIKGQNQDPIYKFKVYVNSNQEAIHNSMEFETAKELGFQINNTREDYR